MMIFHDVRSVGADRDRRAAAFDARYAKAAEDRRNMAKLMKASITDEVANTTVPTPADFALVNRQEISQDLKGRLVDAAKIKYSLQPDQQDVWDLSDVMVELRAAVDDLIEQFGNGFAGLHRVLGTAAYDAKRSAATFRKWAGGSDVLAKMFDVTTSGSGVHKAGAPTAQRHSDLGALMQLPKFLRKQVVLAMDDIAATSDAMHLETVRSAPKFRHLVAEIRSLGLPSAATTSVLRLISAA